jgi:hypothetical protein
VKRPFRAIEEFWLRMIWQKERVDGCRLGFGWYLVLWRWDLVVRIEKRGWEEHRRIREQL